MCTPLSTVERAYNLVFGGEHKFVGADIYSRGRAFGALGGTGGVPPTYCMEGEPFSSSGLFKTQSGGGN